MNSPPEATFQTRRKVRLTSEAPKTRTVWQDRRDDKSASPNRSECSLCDIQEREVENRRSGKDGSGSGRRRIDVREFSISQDETRFGEGHVPLRKRDKGIHEHRALSIMRDEAKDHDFWLPSADIPFIPKEHLVQTVSRDPEVQDLKLGT